MVIKDDLLKGIEKLSPEDRLKRLKEIEERIKLEERITEEIIVKEREETREKQETDERTEREERDKRQKQRKKELEEVVEQEKIVEQEQESVKQVEYHARLVTEVDQTLNKMEYMNQEQLSTYQSQAQDMYDKLNQAYSTAVGWMKDDIRSEKERLKKLGQELKWWERAPGDD